MLAFLSSSAPAADLSLELLAKPPAASGLLLRVTGLAGALPPARDSLALSVRPLDAPDAPEKPLAFLSARLRNALLLDVREVPPLPRARYRLTLTVGSGAVARAVSLDDVLEYSPPDLDVALVIDQSFSMRRTDPERLRVAAAKAFVDLAASGNRIRSIAVVAFDARNETLIPLAPPSDGRRFHEAIDKIGTLGQTDIDGALDRARAELGKGSSRGKAALLLTDGENQPDPYKNAHRKFAEAGWPVYTVGLSKEADAATLKRIAAETGGVFFDAPTGDQLREVFSRICLALERHVPVRKAAVDLKADTPTSDVTLVEDTVSGVSFSARAAMPEFSFSVSPPEGRAATAAQTGATGPYKFATFQKPATGGWTATVRAPGACGVQLETTAVTPLFPLLMPLEREYKYGEPVEVACTLAEGARPVAGAQVSAELRTADGKSHAAALDDLGSGVYGATFAGRLEPGEFALVVLVRGKTAAGNPFERRAETAGRIARPLEPEIWAAQAALQLGPVYNGEAAQGQLTLRKILPPFTSLDLAARVASQRIPADAFRVELGKPDADGAQTLTLAFTAPLSLAAGRHAASLVVTLGPKTVREILVAVEVVNPKLSAEPATLVFGPMLAGSRLERRLSLRAEPRGRLAVALDLAGEAGGFSSVDRATAEVGAEPVVVTVAASPPRGTAAAAYAGTLRIAGDFERKNIPIAVTVARLSISCEPDPVDLGSVEAGGRAVRKVIIRATGPAPADATVSIESDAALARDVLRVNPAAIRLDPARPVEVDVTLALPYPHPVGEFAGRIRVRTDEEVGSVAVRGRVVPAQTFAVEPADADFGAVEIGQRADAAVTLRSLVDVAQEIRVEPRGGPEFLAAGAAVIRLPARGTASLALSCLAPVETPAGAVRREVALIGPMLPHLLTISAVLGPPRGGSFRLDREEVPLGDARPGGELGGSLGVVSTLDVEQWVGVTSRTSPDQSAWLRTPGAPVRVGPRSAVQVPFSCSLSPGAPEGSSRLQMMVRGTFEERTVGVTVRVIGGAPAAGTSGRYFIVVLLLLGILITAALAFVIIRMLVRMPGHRMVKYFTASAVLNLGFILIISQVVAVQAVIREISVTVRLESVGEGETAVQPELAASRPITPDERAGRVESERVAAGASDPARGAATAEAARLEAARREQERRQAGLESRVEAVRPELSRLSTRQLEEVVDAAEKMKRELEAGAAQPGPAALGEDRFTAGGSDERGSLAAAGELVRAARELIAQRGGAGGAGSGGGGGSGVEAGGARVSRVGTGLVETLIDEARSAPRGTGGSAGGSGGVTAGSPVPVAGTHMAPGGSAGFGAGSGSWGSGGPGLPGIGSGGLEARGGGTGRDASVGIGGAGPFGPSAGGGTGTGIARLAAGGVGESVGSVATAPARETAGGSGGPVGGIIAGPTPTAGSAGSGASSGSSGPPGPAAGFGPIGPSSGRGGGGRDSSVGSGAGGAGGPVALSAALPPGLGSPGAGGAGGSGLDLGVAGAPERFGSAAGSAQPAALVAGSGERMTASGGAGRTGPDAGPSPFVGGPLGPSSGVAGVAGVERAFGGGSARGELLVASASAPRIGPNVGGGAGESLELGGVGAGPRRTIAAAGTGGVESYGPTGSGRASYVEGAPAAHAPVPAAPLSVQPEHSGGGVASAAHLGNSGSGTGPERVSVSRVITTGLVDRRAGGTVAFALARYGGDWDCDATAMPNLAYQLERRVGITLATENRTLDLTDPNLVKQPFLFVSGHKDFRYTDAELAALRRFIAAGGSLWINDSTDELDVTFDRAVRRELKRLLPNNDLERLPKNHSVFSSGYDLTKGFRGYAIPPGDKYRCDYLEGINVAGRTAVVYTRNDYGDGLEIDPNTAPLMPSLTDLSPHDMQEGATRMGINIVLYFLRGRPGSADPDRIAEAVRSSAARSEFEARSALEGAEILVLDNFDSELSWKVEPDWGDAAEIAPATPYADKKNIALSVRFTVGEKKKIGLGRDLNEERDLSKHNALVIDATSRLTSGCRVAVGIVTMPDWKYFESPPAYIRPGANPNLVFRLDVPNFKSPDTNWKYTASIANPSAVRQVVLLIYPISSGSIEFDNVRAAKLKVPAAPPASK